MAKPDKQLVAAQKIADVWLKKAKKYKSDFHGMYPGPKQTLKDFLKSKR